MLQHFFGGLAARRQEQPHDVPKQQGHRSEQSQRGRDVLADAIVVQHVRGVVQNIAAGEGDHGIGEDRPQGKAEQDGDDDQSHRRKATEDQNRAEKREVLTRDHHGGGQNTEQHQRGESEIHL